MTKKNLPPKGLLADDLRTRFKLAAAWASAMFLYAYADIINFVLEPGALQEILGGEIGGMAINGTSLFGAAALMTCSSMMIAVSALLRPKLSRWINIIYGGFSTLLIPILAFTGDTWGYYYLFNAFEFILTSYIVWCAINWPVQQSESLSVGEPTAVEPVGNAARQLNAGDRIDRRVTGVEHHKRAGV